jgi:uncharacterized membrane protein
MNATHQHLVLNHLPFGCLLIGFMVFLLAWLRGQGEAAKAGLWILVVGGAFGTAAYVTGNAAATELGASLNAVRPQVHIHAQAGIFGLVSTVVTAVVAGGALALARKRRLTPRGYTIFLMVVNLWALGVVARVSYLGALISHPEIHTGKK